MTNPGESSSYSPSLGIPLSELNELLDTFDDQKEKETLDEPVNT
jgi:hypothetical protein